MLLPENPEKKPLLWDALAMQLAGIAMCFIIKDGASDPLAEAKELSQNEAKLVLARLRAAQICRISANRGTGIAPHFAGNRKSDTVLITEFLTFPSEAGSAVDNAKLKQDLETAVINLLFTESGVNAVLVSLPITPWEMRHAEISLVKEGLMFSKRG